MLIRSIKIRITYGLRFPSALGFNMILAYIWLCLWKHYTVLSRRLHLGVHLSTHSQFLDKRTLDGHKVFLKSEKNRKCLGSISDKDNNKKQFSKTTFNNYEMQSIIWVLVKEPFYQGNDTITPTCKYYWNEPHIFPVHPFQMNRSKMSYTRQSLCRPDCTLSRLIRVDRPVTQSIANS